MHECSLCNAGLELLQIVLWNISVLNSLVGTFHRFLLEVVPRYDVGYIFLLFREGY